MKEKTLVVLAAGMGSRFGGLKQIEPVGPNGEILADYSVYDAIRSGFTKVVFVIREEHLDYFKQNITNHYQGKIEVDFAFQALNKVPADVKVPATREKMWGTTHALLCAKDKVKSGFVMINGDDFYGLSSYQKAATFLDEVNDAYEYMTVNYPFCLASSENGKVNRGLVKAENGYVVNIDECVMEEIDGIIHALSYKTGEELIVDRTSPVSMNFFVFQNTVFELLEKDFNEFIHGEITEKNECFVPNTIKKYLSSGKIKFRAELAESKWLGITYKEDIDNVKEEILKLIEEGIYPNNLWE